MKSFFTSQSFVNWTIRGQFDQCPGAEARPSELKTLQLRRSSHSLLGWTSLHLGDLAAF